MEAANREMAKETQVMMKMCEQTMSRVAEKQSEI
jgi:hypothetical protein